MRTGTGRILTFFSIFFFIALSFSLLFSDSKHTQILYKRDSTAASTTPAITSGTQDNPAPSQTQTQTQTHLSNSKSIQPTTSSPKPSTTTPTSTTVPDKSTSTPPTSTLTSSDAVPSSTSTLAVQTTTSSQISSDSSTSSSVVASTSIQTSNAPSVTYRASQSPAITTAKVTNQATVMQTGTASALPTTTISASAAPVQALASGFWANKGAVAGTFTVVSLIAIVLLCMGRSVIARRRRRARYRREDEEAYAEKPTQQYGGDSGLDEVEASMTNIMTPASADAYPDRQIHFGATPPLQVPEVMYTPQDYGIEYPPGTNYHHADFQYGSNAETVTHYRPSLSQSTPGHPIVDPHHGNLVPIDGRDVADNDLFYNNSGPSYAV